MSDDANTPDTQTTNEDSFADAVTAVLVVVIPVVTIIYWLSGMPTS